jgi:hypothetical protein
MKKLILIASTLFITSSLLTAQSSVIVNDFSNGQVSIANNSILSLTTLSGDHLTTEINVKNTSNTTKVYKLKRTDEILNPGASAYFCVGGGNCYTPATTIAPLSVTLTANGTSGDDLYSQSLMYLLDLEEATNPGISHIKYEIYDVNNPSDLFTFTIYYNDAVSVKENSQLFASISNVYPNPSINSANINLVSAEFLDNATLSITNSLGAIVSSKKIDLVAGKNTVTINSEFLVSGIYFVTISSNKNKIVKKFTVNK